MADNLKQSTFEQFLNQSFQIKLENYDPIDLELIEVKQYAISPMDGRYKAIQAGEKAAPFALLFRGDRNIALPQHLYSFNHSEMGDFVMSIVPVGINDEGRLYEAVFN